MSDNNQVFPDALLQSAINPDLPECPECGSDEVWAYKADGGSVWLCKCEYCNNQWKYRPKRFPVILARFTALMGMVATLIEAHNQDHSHGRSCGYCRRPVPGGCRYYHADGACLR